MIKVTKVAFVLEPKFYIYFFIFEYALKLNLLVLKKKHINAYPLVTRFFKIRKKVFDITSINSDKI